MTAVQRVAFNTLATYLRTLLGVALGLFSGRWILQALGEVDYGLLGVVGGLFTFVSFINGVSASSCSRYFALSIGSGDTDETSRWFNTALSIHIVLPLVLFLIGWPVGEWVIDHVLVIPPDRLSTAHWVFRFSAVSSLVSMVASPYMGMMIAKQNIAELSFWQICQVLFNFFFVYWLLSYKGDAWFVYALALCAITIGMTLIQSVRARMLFSECKLIPNRLFLRDRVVSVLKYSGWQLFGAFSGIARTTLIAVLINRFYPPTKVASANASFSVGGTVTGYSQTLSMALVGALTPEITATEGKGDRSSVISKSNRSSKFATLLVGVVAVPLLLEIKTVLALWLKNPPELAWIFCVFMIAQLLIEKLSIGHSVAINAVGRIAKYQVLAGGCYIMAFPLAWLWYALGGPVWIAGASLLITTTGVVVIQVVLGRQLVGYEIMPWVKSVLIPSVVVIGIGFAVGFAAKQLIMLPSFLHVVAISVVSVCAMVLSAWVFLFDAREKKLLRDQVGFLLTKMRRRS